MSKIYQEKLIPDYKNINLIQNVNFDPNNRVGTKSFARKYTEAHFKAINPDVSKDNKFVVESSSYNLNTHYMLGTIDADINTEKQDNFKVANQPAIVESQKNFLFNKG